MPANRWSRLRLAMGLLQMGGATSALVFLAKTGITTTTLVTVVATTLLTTMSVMIFGRSRPNRLPR